MLPNAYIAYFDTTKFLSELQNRAMSRFHQVVAWSFGGAVTLYCLVTAFGFLTFGMYIRGVDEVNSNVLFLSLGGTSGGLVLNNYSTKDVIASQSLQSSSGHFHHTLLSIPIQHRCLYFTTRGRSLLCT